MPADKIIERRRILVGSEIPVQLEKREADTGLPKITGYTAVFGVDSTINTYFGSFNERIQKGAFGRAIREGQDVRALRNHEPDNLLGRTVSKTLRLKEDNTGLHIEIDPPDTSIGRDTVESVRRGDLSGMSFAFIVRKEKWVNGEDGSPSLRIIQDVDLYDVGPVTYPAYEQTTADVRSASLAHRVGMAEMGLEVPKLAEEKEEEPKKEEPLPEGEVVKEEKKNEEEEVVKEEEGEAKEEELKAKLVNLELRARRLRLKSKINELEIQSLDK